MGGTNRARESPSLEMLTSKECGILFAPNRRRVEEQIIEGFHMSQSDPKFMISFRRYTQKNNHRSSSLLSSLSTRESTRLFSVSGIGTRAFLTALPNSSSTSFANHELKSLYPPLSRHTPPWTPSLLRLWLRQ